MLFLCLIVICLYFNEITLAAFMPTNTVWGHSAVLSDTKIYFTGGLYPKNPNNFDGVTFSKEFFYLDVSKRFNNGVGELLPWGDLSTVSQILPTHSWSSFLTCGYNNNLILNVGEFGPPGAPNGNSIFVYDIKSQQWSNPMTTNQPQYSIHSGSQTVCDIKTKKMYRFSGLPPPGGPNPPPISNNVDILDTWMLLWQLGNAATAPEGRFDHTGTLLANGYIVYIGGTLGSSGVPVDLSVLPLYSITDDTWTTMNTTGYLPTPRAYNSAVLTEDGRIIVYGGFNGTGAAIDDLVILDTTQPVFTWSRAYVSTASPPSRFYHTATLVGDYMIVAFGRNNIFLPLPQSNEVFILYTGNQFDYQWVNEFIPAPKPNPKHKHPKNKAPN
ncbi:hypothetical protein RclHR1_01210026 [Rhizophagus clarus]|uniref:Galactose oxidase n=1 Tax=Rhizophagus clarus TaxID=94130 RepID=A0A2Z6QY73_9GLOM|nr:hypothetical protein RclHR1_01210026 [Rhizophagus clarus]GES97659.1 hypothetical protein GLOIN_2v1641931 [Rhizophagus clarus]